MKNNRDTHRQTEIPTHDLTSNDTAPDHFAAKKAKKKLAPPKKKRENKLAGGGNRNSNKEASRNQNKDNNALASQNVNNNALSSQNVNNNVPASRSPRHKSAARTPHENFLRRLRRDKAKVLLLQLVILVGFFGLWELLTAMGVLDSFIFSSPSRVLKMLNNLGIGLLKHIGITLLECVLSFVISTVLGTLIALCLWWSSTARRVLEPYIVVLSSLPKIALGPIIIVWAGVGMKSIVLMSILICIVVTVISALSGFVSCDEGKILLLRSMGANKHQIFFKLVLPNAVPELLSVLKVNVGLAWVGTIMGEYLVSGAGLGYLIIYGGQVFKLDLVMLATLVLCMLATVMYLIVALLEKLLTRHRIT